MVGLIDIAPVTETVVAQGKPITVHGVSAKGLAHLLARFPEMRRLMTGQEVQADQLLAMGGDAVAAIIAAGCGYPGDNTAEIIAGGLSLDVQADLLAAILRLTLPKGIGPFVEKLTALGNLLGVEEGPSDTVRDTKSRKPSTR
jgi:hypothetical protein